MYALLDSPGRVFTDNLGFAVEQSVSVLLLSYTPAPYPDTLNASRDLAGPFHPR